MSKSRHADKDYGKRRATKALERGGKQRPRRRDDDAPIGSQMERNVFMETNLAPEDGPNPEFDRMLDEHAEWDRGGGFGPIEDAVLSGGRVEPCPVTIGTLLKQRAR